MAMTVEDVLARRLRLLFLDAKAAVESAPLVAEIMAAELGQDQAWIRDQLESFNAVAEGYILH
jgi:glycerol-3-phosphate dehydrogenase